MIMLGRKKQMLNHVLGPMPEEHAEGGDVGDDAPLHAIAHELIQSVHAHDVPGTVEALKAFFSSCDSDEYDEE